MASQMEAREGGGGRLCRVSWRGLPGCGLLADSGGLRAARWERPSSRRGLRRPGGRCLNGGVNLPRGPVQCRAVAVVISKSFSQPLASNDETLKTRWGPGFLLNFTIDRRIATKCDEYRRRPVSVSGHVRSTLDAPPSAEDGQSAAQMDPPQR